jgi:hypothetical protein
MSEYFENENNVKEYIKICEGYNGMELIKIFKEYVPLNTKILEIGIGPGNDLDILKKEYKVLGTDYSQIFIDYYRKKDSTIELEKVDGREMKMKNEMKFQGIYSNKSLIYFSKEELTKSLELQSEKLEKEGILFHSFWFGKGFEEISKTYFYNFENLQECINNIENLKIEKIEKYTEIEDGDSIYIILKRNK